MASLKEIKTRIASVQSTRKITSAMKMVASSKLHHAQYAIECMLPYEAMLEHILPCLYARYGDSVRRTASCETCSFAGLLFQQFSLWRIQCQCYQTYAAGDR